MLTRQGTLHLLDRMGLLTERCAYVDVEVRFDAMSTVSVTYAIGLKELAEMLVSLNEPNNPTPVLQGGHRIATCDKLCR